MYYIHYTVQNFDIESKSTLIFYPGEEPEVIKYCTNVAKNNNKYKAVYLRKWGKKLN